MRASFEIKEDNKTTTYTADLSQMGESAKKLVEKVSSFFEDVFKDIFTKETSTKEE